MKKLKLLWLVITGIISFKYWWNYTNAKSVIYIQPDTIKGSDQLPVVILHFGREMRLIGEDHYIVKDVDAVYVNKELKTPIISALYRYNPLTYTFDLLMWP